MAHIHEKIDFTVAIFVVAQEKVLLIHHRKLNTWLPLGGHIELEEDPEIAALREAKEESGLDVELLGERPPTTGPGTRALIAPRFLDIHRISATHEHIGMIYWARPKRSAANSDRSAGLRPGSNSPTPTAPDRRPALPAAEPPPGEIVLAAEEHHAIRWCAAADLDSLQPPMAAAVKWYSLQAIAEISRLAPAPALV